MMSIKQVALNELGLLKISGPHCTDFLQGQLSCDVKEVTLTHSRLAVHCNAKGRVLFTARLFYFESDYYLLMPIQMVDRAYEDFKRYARFAKVKLSNVSQQFQKVGYVSDTQSMLAKALHLKLAENSVHVFEKTIYLSIPGTLSRVVALTEGESHVLQDVIKQPYSLWENIDVTTGVVFVTSEIRGLFTPHHLNYHQQGGVSFSKGCYTGQEIVARMHYLGQLKQKLYQFQLHGSYQPSIGTNLVDEGAKQQGTLVAITLLKANNTYQALGVIQDSALLAPLYLQGTQLTAIQPAFSG